MSDFWIDKFTPICLMILIIIAGLGTLGIVINNAKTTTSMIIGIILTIAVVGPVMVFPIIWLKNG